VRDESADDAFAPAAAHARQEHGTGPLTGAFCEKHAYVVIARDVMTLKRAVELATELIEESAPRIDSSGPAGCIKLTTGEHFFFGRGGADLANWRPTLPCSWRR
jgi:hypothetical protein